MSNIIINSISLSQIIYLADLMKKGHLELERIQKIENRKLKISNLLK